MSTESGCGRAHSSQGRRLTTRQMGPVAKAGMEQRTPHASHSRVPRSKPHSRTKTALSSLCASPLSY